MNYQKLIIVGNASSDAQIRKSKKGDVTFTTFNVAVGSVKSQVSFFPVAVFGVQGETMAKLVTKGRQVLIEGHIEVKEGWFNVIADRVVLGAASQQSKAEEKLQETK